MNPLAGLLGYRLLVWDHEKDDWEIAFDNLYSFQVRDGLRKLLGRGYDLDLSILIQRFDEDGKQVWLDDGEEETFLQSAMTPCESAP